MKDFYLINASPRNHGNSARMLEAFSEGIKSVLSSEEAFEIHWINLYELTYKGCYECFLCRKKDSPWYGHCGYPDEIRELLDKIAHADGIVISTPIYFHNVPGELRSFLERLMYPFISYPEGGRQCLAPKKIPVALIYTMNVTEDEMREKKYRDYLWSIENWIRYVFGDEQEILYAFNTYQYSDYSKYEAGAWDLKKKYKKLQMGLKLSLITLNLYQ